MHLRAGVMSLASTLRPPAHQHTAAASGLVMTEVPGSSDVQVSTRVGARDDHAPAPAAPLWLVYLTLALANAAEAVEVNSAGFMLHRATDDPAGQTAIATGVFVGMFIGGFVSGAAADGFGRTPALRWSLTLATIAAAAASAAPDLNTLVLLRVLAGTGVGAATPPLFALAHELAPPGKSGQAVTVVASFWMVGSCIAAVLAYWMLSASVSLPPSFDYDQAWRPFALACSGVPLLSLVLAWLVPLSPPPSPQAPSESTGLAPAPPKGRHLERLLRKLTKSTTRHALLPLMVVWAGLNFGSYGLSTWITTLLHNDGVDDPYLVALLYAAAMLPGNALSVLAIDRIGRKPLLVGSMALSAAAAIGLGAADASSRPLVILAACTFSAASNAGWNALDVLSVEAFSVEIRATAFAMLAASGRVASIGAQVINGALSEDSSTLLGVTSAVMLIGCAGAAVVPRPRLGADVSPAAADDHAQLMSSDANASTGGPSSQDVSHVTPQSHDD